MPLGKMLLPTGMQVPELRLSMPTRSGDWTWCWGVGIGLLATGLACAQGSSFKPTLAVSTTYSDTRGQLLAEADRQFVTQISPGFSWVSRQGRVQGSVDYTLNARFYSKQDEADSRQNALAASLKVEAIKDWFFVDGRASVAQEAISPFGQPVSGSLAVNDNATEVRTYSLSPYVRGSAFGSAVYEARWTSTQTRGARAVESNSSSDTGLVSLSSASAAKIGWSVLASRQKVDFGSGANSANDRVNAQVSMAVDPELRVGLTGGRESTDVVGGARRSYDNWGWTLRWTPSQRTDLSVLSERRYFGNSHSFSFSHRMRRSNWVYTDTRGTTSGAGASGTGQPVSLYSLYFNLFAAQEPDPTLRDQLVRRFLLTIGQDPGALVAGGFLNSGVTLQRRQDLAVALQGVRTSISLQAYRGDTRQLQTTGSTLGTLPIQQSGFVASASYRLTPSSSVSLSGSLQRTASNGIEPESDTRSASLSWSATMGPHISTTVALRHTDFDNLSNPYREAAATASLIVRF
jgi:uncharacterized protein (PEP-CTERM system associated)